MSLRGAKSFARVMLSLCFVLLSQITVAPVQAHPLAPSLLRIVLETPYQASLVWKQPLKQASNVTLKPRLPDGCIAEPGSVKVDPSGAVSELLSISCDIPLPGQAVTLDGLAASGTYVIAELIDPAGRRFSWVLDPEQTSFTIPAAGNVWQGRQGFFVMGIEHLLGGLDHLLFILGLTLLLRNRLRSLLVAFTAFTGGHTLALVGAWYAWLNAAPGWFGGEVSTLIEMLIMVSLVWMALEILNQQGKPGRFSLRRAPFTLTLLFGLVHGGGFAGSLLAQLVPGAGVLWNIAAFNLGLEAGQLMVVLVLLLVWFVLKRRTIPHSLRWLNPAMAYGMGGVSCYWLLKLAI